jgi:hypothetical protein
MGEMTAMVCPVCVWAWALGFIFTPVFSEGKHGLGEAIWWPLIVFKHALKGLWRVLFTGWRP